MLRELRKINLKKAGFFSCMAGVTNVIVHILVIIQILPYTWVNGGRTETLIAAKELSNVSIIITLVNILIALIASQIIPLRLNRFWGIALSIFLIITLPFGFIGIIQQFLGTTFEKCVMGLVTIIGFCADTRIALEKRW